VGSLSFLLLRSVFIWEACFNLQKMAHCTLISPPKMTKKWPKKLLPESPTWVVSRGKNKVWLDRLYNFFMNKSGGSDCIFDSAILTLRVVFFSFFSCMYIRCTFLNCYKVFTFSSRSPTKRLTCSTLRGLLHPTLRSSFIYVLRSDSSSISRTSSKSISMSSAP